MIGLYLDVLRKFGVSLWLESNIKYAASAGKNIVLLTISCIFKIIHIHYCDVYSDIMIFSSTSTRYGIPLWVFLAKKGFLLILLDFQWGGLIRV